MGLYKTLKLGVQEYNNLPRYLKQESARPRPVDRTIQPQGESGEVSLQVPYRTRLLVPDCFEESSRLYPQKGGNLVGYKVVVYCPECYLEEFQGCFAGHSEELEPTFATDEEAYDAGNAKIKDSPWVFDIIKVEE